jgi:hypothetical protein
MDMGQAAARCDASARLRASPRPRADAADRGLYRIVLGRCRVISSTNASGLTPELGAWLPRVSRPAITEIVARETLAAITQRGLGSVTECGVITLTDTSRGARHPMRTRKKGRDRATEGRKGPPGLVMGDRPDLAVAALRSGQAKAQGPSVEAVPPSGPRWTDPARSCTYSSHWPRARLMVVSRTAPMSGSRSSCRGPQGTSAAKRSCRRPCRASRGS